MRKYLYLIKKQKIKSWLKFWLLTKDQVKYILSEILEGFSFDLQNTVKRYFKIFNIFGNSVQDGTPSPENPVPIYSVADDVNLFDIEKAINSYLIKNTDGSYTFTRITSGGRFALTVPCSIPANVPFYIYYENIQYQGISTGEILSAVINYSDGTVTTMPVYSTDYNFNNAKRIHNKEIISIQLYLESTLAVGDSITFENFKIQLNSPVKAYSPYNYGTLTIDFEGQTENYNYTFITKPLRSLPNGVRDSLEDDGIHRRVGRQIISYGTFYDGTNWNGYIVYLTNKTNKYNNALLCTKAIFTSPNTPEDGTVYENQGNIMFVGNNEDTLETLKSKYDGAEVLYELAEEVIEPYTEEQQEQYNKIKELYTFDGTTNISSDDEVPPYLQIQYYMKGE